MNKPDHKKIMFGNSILTCGYDVRETEEYFDYQEERITDLIMKKNMLINAFNILFDVEGNIELLFENLDVDEYNSLMQACRREMPEPEVTNETTT